MSLSNIEQLLLLGLVPVLWLAVWLGWFRRALRKPAVLTDSPTGRELAERLLADVGVPVQVVSSTPTDLYDPWLGVVRLSPRAAEGRDGLSLAIAALEASHARMGRDRKWLEQGRAGAYLGLRLGGSGILLLSLGFLILSGGSEGLLFEALKLPALALPAPLLLWPFEFPAFRAARAGLPPEHHRTLLIWTLARTWFPLRSAGVRLPLSMPRN